MMANKLQTFSVTEAQRASVYDRVLSEIEEGKLLPGERLREAELASRLGVSRTPIRETLKLLEMEGLVVYLPRQGASVKKLSYAEVMELYDMRTALESTAARLAAHVASRLELQNLTLIHEELASTSDSDLAFRLNRKFHFALLHAAKNRYLTQSMSTFHKSLMLLGRTTLDDVVRMQEAIIEHENLLEALNKRNADMAEKVMRIHIEASQKKRIRDLLDRDLLEQ